jgi:hypothetical protein
MQRIRFFRPVLAIALSLVPLGLAWPSLAENPPNLRQGLPGRRISGGVRGPGSTCFTNFDQSLVALLPQNSLGKTASPHPVFWFSMPETQGATLATFQLFNQADELIYQTPVQTAGGGLSEFQLPAAAPALAVDEVYKWVFTVACDGSSAPQLGLMGWVQRVALAEDVAVQVAIASPAERVSLYAAAGLWHEQVNQLASLRRSQLANVDLQVDLQLAALMQSAELSAYLSDQLAAPMSVRPIAPFATELGMPPE